MPLVCPTPSSLYWTVPSLSYLSSIQFACRSLLSGRLNLTMPSAWMNSGLTLRHRVSRLVGSRWTFFALNSYSLESIFIRSTRLRNKCKNLYIVCSNRVFRTIQQRRVTCVILWFGVVTLYVFKEFFTCMTTMEW